MDVPHYYNINKILLSSIGLWPYQSRLASRSIFALAVLISLSAVVPAVAAGVKYRNQTYIVLECIAPYILDIGCTAKLLTCMVHSKKILKVMNFIIEDWKVWGQDQEITILHAYAQHGQKITIAYAVGVYFSTTTYVLQPLALKVIDKLVYNGTTPGEFPYPVYYYHLDVQKYYYYIIGYLLVGCLGLLSNIVATDTMFIVFMQHNCAIFAALGQKLRRIGVNTHEADKTNNELDTLETCIVRHNHAIEFANLIESIYTVNFFVILGLNMLIMSFTGLQIFTRISSPQEILKYVVFIQIQMVHLFVECYFSQSLLDHSASIRDDIFCGEWYNAPLKTQRLLCLMILRCSKPCKLTAWKICDMSLETFLGIVKTSMSYFTLLRSVQ